MRWRIWPWFVAGFALTFVVVGVSMKTSVMLPTGWAVMDMTWFGYYRNDWPRFFDTALGPANVNPVRLIGTTLIHLVLAALGGLVAAAIPWWVNRSQHRQPDS